METVIYLSPGGINVLSGEYKNNQIEVKNCQTYPIEEGAMINGVVTDEAKIIKVLEELAKTTSKAKLVVSSTQILRKEIVAPKLKQEEMIALVADELRQLTNDNLNSDDMLYDYAILKDKLEDSKGIGILAVGVARDFIKNYMDMFEKVGITITGIDISYNVMNKLISHSKELEDKTFIWANINGTEVSVNLYRGNDQIFSQNSRFFSEVGSSGYVNEVNSIVLKMINFNRANYRDVEVEEIMFSNVGKDEAQMLFDVVSTSTDIPVKAFEAEDLIKYAGNNPIDFEAHRYLYNLGALIGR